LMAMPGTAEVTRHEACTFLLSLRGSVLGLVRRHDAGADLPA
jgi:hypothetical protein